MSLGKKTLVLFLALGCAICLGSYIVLRMSILPTFAAFEQQAARDGLARIDSILDSRLEALRILNLEYSAWDDAVLYMRGRNPEFQDDNLTPGYWHSIDISALIVMDSDGQLHYGWIVDPTDGHELSLDDELLEPLSPDHVLVRHESEFGEVSGLFRTRSGLLHVTSYPIVGTEGEGPIYGALIIGQFLSADRMEAIGERATAELSLHITDGGELPPHVEAAFRDSRRADTAVMTYNSYAHGFEILTDIHGQRVAVLEIRQPRTISQIGSDTIRTTMLSLAVGSIGFLLAALLLIRRLIVSPIEWLTVQIRNIQDTGNLEFEADESRSDEVGALASRFAELTRGLRRTREELENARDEALSMSRAKSEFLARMSHEIRTPMNGVLGMTELLQSTPLDKKQKHFARTIYSSAESLLHIINDILDISKIEAGKLDLDIAPFNLRHLVEESLDLLADTAHRKGLELIGVIPDDTFVTVQGDALRLRQVLVNLVSNAVKFTQTGEIIVRVEACERDDEEAHYRFEVQDTGIGISDKNMQKIFDPFTQEDGSTTRRFGGTGLGLSICKQLLDLMGGDIGVERNEAGGCTFWFTVVLGCDDAVSEVIQPALLSGKRILIVDDNATNRETLQLQLESWQVRVEAASSGPEALGVISSSAIDGRPFDLVLLDMNMPEMDGVQLAAAIRHMTGGEEMPLIMLSSVSTGDADDSGRPNVIDAWLTKPVRQARLYEALVSHFSRVEGVDDVREHQASVVSAANDNKHESLRVLLAEDNDVNQAVATGMLDDLGHDTVVVGDGRAAVALFKEQRFDLILMDCQMPGLDGFEATRQIRRWERDRRLEPTRIVALTANALSGDRERCISVGMDDYISKPFTRDVLDAVVSPGGEGDGELADTVDPRDTKTGHVLIVDDNSINQQITSAIVRALGMSADIASDGDQALEAFQSTRFDIVLMDCHMPGRNGYDATREIRRLERESSSEDEIPVIAVTADLMQSNRQRCLDAGMNDYLAKPFTEQQLRAVMRRWLGGSSDGAEISEVALDADGFSEFKDTTSLASIDRLALEEIILVDPSSRKDMVRGIIASFCSSSSKLILELHQAITSDDHEQVELLAHSLKGSSGQVGAVLLAALCEQILICARSADLSNAVSLCERATVEQSAIVVALDKELRRLAA